MHAGKSWLTTILLFGALALSQSQPPRIFYSDLESGPNTGGESNEGVFVTIYGTGFGDARGGSTISVGKGNVGSYRIWTNTKIAFQLGPHTSSGDIVVQTSSGKSNGVPFEVRPGHIYFVAVNGDDRNAGSRTSPWRTLPHAVHSISSGDTVYGMDGVSASEEDGEGWKSAILLRHTWCSPSGYPRALIGYPGAQVTIGNPTGKPEAGLRSTDFSGGGGACAGNWVFANLRFRGLSPLAINGPSSHWRIVANDISCPLAEGSDGGGACVTTSRATNVQFYGNDVHDAGSARASALFHGVYFSTDSNHIDMGWNTVSNIHGCRGVQIHSSPLGVNVPDSGLNQFDIAIHDNLIHDTQCDGIAIDTIDPSKGPVKIYNNLIYRAGIGPNNPEKTGGWACIYISAKTEKGPPGSGVVDIYNNTLYACGTFAQPPYGSANAAIVASGRKVVELHNNLIYQVPTSLHKSGVPYLIVWNPSNPEHVRVCADTENCPGIQGSNNLFFGSGPVPPNRNLSTSFGSDPGFTDVSKFDFHLKESSAARGHGINIGLKMDADGNARGPAEYDIGAYQFVPPQNHQAATR